MELRIVVAGIEEYAVDQVEQRFEQGRKRLRQRGKLSPLVQVVFVLQMRIDRARQPLRELREFVVTTRTQPFLRNRFLAVWKRETPDLRSPLGRERPEILGKAREAVHLRDRQVNGEANAQLLSQFGQPCAQCGSLGDARLFIRACQRRKIDRQQCAVDRRTRAVSAQ